VEHPHFPLKEEANFLQHDCFVLSTGTDKEQEIDVKELTGAACVFHGKHAGVRNHGWSCWNVAMALRESNNIPKICLTQSTLEKNFVQRTEITSFAGLRSLRRHNRMAWISVALIEINFWSRSNSNSKIDLAINSFYDEFDRDQTQNFWSNSNSILQSTFLTARHLLIGKTIKCQ
jgi:hypothetical protein